MKLEDGSRVGVIGGGPAGSMSSFFLLEMAQRIGVDLHVDIYEPKDFTRSGPAACNMCGGVISESLVQLLAAEGINLHPSVVQRGIDSYVLHTDRGRVRIVTPTEEMRIAALHRGSGPKGAAPGQIRSFDGFLLDFARGKGAQVLPCRVTGLRRDNGRPVVKVQDGAEQTYDLVIGAVGINSPALKLFEDIGIGFRKPRAARTWIAEILLGRDAVQKHLGNSMHVFLLDIPRLEFAAIIPKGDYVTACMLGDGIDRDLVDRFMTSPEVRSCLPVEWDAHTPQCHCEPRINMGGARGCFADRVVLVGDCAVSRLYKDGIGAAYRAAKACAVTAIFRGVSNADFEAHYWKTCRGIERDNRIGKALFLGSAFFRRWNVPRQAMLRMIEKEHASPSSRRPMSVVMWNLFTGSAPYRAIAARGLMPDFLFSFLAACLQALIAPGTAATTNPP
jgi:flavin-dependent dehydrogenase